MGNTLTSTQDSQLSTMDTQDIINYVPAAANFITQNELSDKLANYLPANSFGPAAAYVTQTQLNELHHQLQQESGSLSANYALQSDVQQNYQPKGNYALATDLNNYATVSQLQNYAPAGNYATRNDLKNSLAAYQPKGDYQPSGTYATVGQLNQYATVSQLKNYAPAGNYATVSQLNQYATVSRLNNYATVSQLNQYATVSQLNNYATVNQLNQLNQDIDNDQSSIRQRLHKHFIRKTDDGNVIIPTTLYINKICDNSGMNKCYDVTNNMQPVPYSPDSVSSSTPAAYSQSFTLSASSIVPSYALSGFHPISLDKLPSKFTLMNTATGKYWNAENNQINDGGTAAIISADKPVDLYNQTGNGTYRLAINGVSGYVCHAGYVMWTKNYVPNNYDFAWEFFLKDGTTNQVAIWNPFPGDGKGNWVVAGTPTAGRQQIANTTTPTLFTLTPN